MGSLSNKNHCWCQNAVSRKTTAGMSVLLLVSLIGFPPMSLAQNLGVEGAVYEIVEPDMLAGIHRKLSLMEQSGELARQKKRLIKQSIRHILRPKRVRGVSDLGKGEAPKSHTIDPSIHVDNDILDPDGRLIAKQGETVNPLDYVAFDEVLLFINGDDPAQVNWAHKLADQNQGLENRLKVILTNGNVRTTTQALKGRVYFDQEGVLCQRFKIRHVPTRVYQPTGSKQLLIQEVSLG